MLIHPAHRALGLLGGVVLALAVAHCSGGKSSTLGSSAPVGPSGGSVASSDGAMQMNVPAGALPQNVTVTVATTTSPAAGALGTVYEIGPTGTHFATPVKMTFHYAGIDLAGHQPSELRVATFAGGAWQPLTGYTLDTSAKTVTGTTTHLSPYALWVAATGAPSCTSVTVGGDCGSSSSSGGSGSTGSSSGITCPPPPTCAGATAATVCTGYPGASLQGCTDNGTGFTASCCFASGTPLCLGVGGGAVCGGSSSGSTGTGSSTGGSSSGSSSGSSGSSASSSGVGGSSSGVSSGGSSSGCTGSPTCATAAPTACAQYPGATLQNCTDSATGYSGGCCFAPNQPVCVKASLAVGCGGSGSGSSTGGSSTGGSTSSGSGCGTTPTCAASNPCDGYPGASLQSCTDTADGYDATCCFPPGTLPSYGGGPVLSGGGSSSGSTGTGSAGSSSGSSDGG